MRIISQCAVSQLARYALKIRLPGSKSVRRVTVIFRESPFDDTNTQSVALGPATIKSMQDSNKVHSSFTALVRPHLEPLYRFAYRLTQNREDAQDLVQDVLLKLHPQADKLAEIKSIAPWLNRVLYNQFVDNQRRYAQRRMRIVEHRDYSADPDIAKAEQASTEELVEGELTITRVQAALEQLSADHQLIINLHDVEGYTLAEIAEITGIPHGTLKSRRHRARTRLQVLLDEGPASAVSTSEDNRGEENDALQPVPAKLGSIS